MYVVFILLYIQMSATNNIKICVRVKPSLINNANPVISVYDNIVVCGRNPNPVTYNFDRCFNENSTNADIFNEFIDSIDAAIGGYNVCVMAYGQTSSGKTYTLNGIVPDILNTLFDHIGRAPTDVKHKVRLSYIEIYNEKIRDLFTPVQIGRGVGVDDNGVYGILDNSVDSAAAAMHFWSLGARNRSTGNTNMNKHSSRSHSIFIIDIITRNNREVRSGKIYVVDLAGSERSSKTGATGDRLTESNFINKSLLSLCSVVNALTTGELPVYRSSKLTHVLKNAIGGNSLTTIIVCCSSDENNIGETKNTLEFAKRAKLVRMSISENVSILSVQPVSNELIMDLTNSRNMAQSECDALHVENDNLKRANIDLINRVMELETRVNAINDELSSCKLELQKTAEVGTEAAELIKELGISTPRGATDTLSISSITDMRERFKIAGRQYIKDREDALLRLTESERKLSRYKLENEKLTENLMTAIAENENWRSMYEQLIKKRNAKRRGNSVVGNNV
jgi:hypothetical protein